MDSHHDPLALAEPHWQAGLREYISARLLRELASEKRLVPWTSAASESESDASAGGCLEPEHANWARAARTDQAAGRCGSSWPLSGRALSADQTGPGSLASV